MTEIVNKIHNCDNKEILKKIPDNSIDLFLEDMPYGVTNCKWDNKIDLVEYWDIRIPKIRDNGLFILTATQPFATDLINSNRKMFRYDLIWQKTMACGHLNCKKMPMRNHEIILVFYNKLPTYNPIMVKKNEVTVKRTKMSSNCYGKYKENMLFYYNSDKRYPVSVINIKHDKERNTSKLKNKAHPTQKPISLFEYLIKTYTNKNDIVFDGYSGGGTTAMACVNSNRNYICCEINTDYYNLSLKRLEKAMQEKQQELFD